MSIKEAMRIVELEDELKYLRMGMVQLQNVVIQAIMSLDDGDVDEAIEMLRQIMGEEE